MPDCLGRPTGSTSFRAQVTEVRSLLTCLAQGLICPKSGTDCQVQHKQTRFIRGLRRIPPLYGTIQ